MLPLHWHSQQNSSFSYRCFGKPLASLFFFFISLEVLLVSGVKQKTTVTETASVSQGNQKWAWFVVSEDSCICLCNLSKHTTSYFWLLSGGQHWHGLEGFGECTVNIMSHLQCLSLCEWRSLDISASASTMYHTYRSFYGSAMLNCWLSFKKERCVSNCMVLFQKNWTYGIRRYW